MKPSQILLAAITVLASTAPAAAQSADAVDAGLAKLCGSNVVEVARDLKKTRDLKAGSKAATESVTPREVVGVEYLDQLIALTAECPKHLEAFLTSPVGKQAVPESATRPGGPVPQATSDLKSLRFVATALKTSARMRLAQVDQHLELIRKHAVAHLDAVVRLGRITVANRDAQARRIDTPQAPANVFDDLRTCAMKLSTLGADMQQYRRRTWAAKQPHDRLAPVQAVHATNIGDVMKPDGWWARCDAEVAQATNATSVPADFRKPHIGGHARMKASLAALKFAGAFLQTSAPQRVQQIDATIDQYRKAANDFMREATRLWQHVDREASR